MTKAYIIPTIRVKALEAETLMAAASYTINKDEDVTSEDILAKPETPTSIWDE